MTRAAAARSLDDHKSVGRRLAATGIRQICETALFAVQRSRLMTRAVATRSLDDNKSESRYAERLLRA